MATQVLTVLTLGAAVGTILGTITAMAVNGYAAYTWSASSNQWIKAS